MENLKASGNFLVKWYFDLKWVESKDIIASDFMEADKAILNNWYYNNWRI